MGGEGDRVGGGGDRGGEGRRGRAWKRRGKEREKGDEVGRWKARREGEDRRWRGRREEEDRRWRGRRGGRRRIGGEGMGDGNKRKEKNYGERRSKESESLTCHRWV